MDVTSVRCDCFFFVQWAKIYFEASILKNCLSFLLLIMEIRAQHVVAIKRG